MKINTISGHTLYGEYKVEGNFTFGDTMGNELSENNLATDTMQEQQKAVQPDAASPSPTAQYKENLVGIPTVISICFLIAIITSVVSIYSYDHWYAQKMIAVDIRGYITQQKADFVAGKLTEEQLKGKFDEMEKVVMAISKNKIVLMGDAVVRNVEVVKIP